MGRCAQSRARTTHRKVGNGEWQHVFRQREDRPGERSGRVRPDLRRSGRPPILLIHGAAASMLAWEEEFCERLAAGPRFVVRYDHRDTSRSVSYEPSAD
jgi:pimeloyl-ACP methyl ester carboxylesterase